MAVSDWVADADGVDVILAIAWDIVHVPRRTNRKRDREARNIKRLPFECIIIR